MYKLKFNLHDDRWQGVPPTLVWNHCKLKWNTFYKLSLFDDPKWLADRDYYWIRRSCAYPVYDELNGSYCYRRI